MRKPKGETTIIRLGECKTYLAQKTNGFDNVMNTFGSDNKSNSPVEHCAIKRWTARSDSIGQQAAIGSDTVVGSINQDTQSLACARKLPGIEQYRRQLLNVA